MIRSNDRSDGSIPTGMGKPVQAQAVGIPQKVYPHGYGETAPDKKNGAIGMGLSPRVWGNQKHLYLNYSHKGSIPTGMGKPIG